MSDMNFQPLGQDVNTASGFEGSADIDPRLTRTHYFDGRLLRARDLVRDQAYLDRRLREVGQALGSGVIDGLNTRFEAESGGRFVVEPGVGVTAAGRVLQLSGRLAVPLDAVEAAVLNERTQLHFDRGIYAVVLSYAETPEDIAEVYPRDLGARRDVQFDITVEGVQLGLVPLAVPLSQQNPLRVRAQLERQLIVNGAIERMIPADSIALGILAIAEDRPLWFDEELARRAATEELTIESMQVALFDHYEALLDEVLSERRRGNRNGDFGAGEIFDVLPPVGSLPKDAVDPVVGRQSFFPEMHRVSIAPVRMADVGLIRRESMRLPVIDLALGEPVDIVILTPLANLEYGQFAQRLEGVFHPETRRLAFPEVRPLSVFRRPRPDVLDTDQATWAEIWDRVQEDQLLYVRRPLRSAETAISGIVLARGFDLPAPPPPAPPQPGVDDPRLLDDTAIVSRYVNFDVLGALRPPQMAQGVAGLQHMRANFVDDLSAIVESAKVLMLAGAEYTEVVWPTLRRVANTGTLVAFRTALQEGVADGTPAGQVVAAMGDDVELTQALRDRWTAAIPS